MSIATELTQIATNLEDALDEINEQIEAKGGTASETIYGISSAVENLPSGGFSATIVVTAPTGSTVTCTKGSTTLTAEEVSGTWTFTVTEEGTWTVTATLGSDTTSEIITVKENYTSSLEYHHIYGAAWTGTSDPTWSRTDDAADFSNPVPYINDGVMTGSDCSSPFDNCYPWRDITVIDNATAGKLVKIPKFWFKWTVNGSAIKLQIANYAAEGFSVSPAHANRGDGIGERDFVYVGRYHCSASNYKSTSGATAVSAQSITANRNGITALGTYIYQYDFAMYWTIAMLYLVEYATWNAKGVIGRGSSSSSIVGVTDTMPYHTGTMSSSRSAGNEGVQYRNIEGLWSIASTHYDGTYAGGNVLYCSFNPATYGTDVGNTSLMTRIGSFPQGTWGSFEISAMSQGTGTYSWLLYPTGTGGTSDTYCCGSFWGDTAAWSSWHSGELFGYAWQRNGNENASCRLQYLPATT